MFEDVGYEHVIYGGLLVGMAALLVGGMAWAIRRGAAREQWEAEHPYPEVEKPKVPTYFRYVNADELEDECFEAIDEAFARDYGRPRAAENDPQVGDVVQTHILYAKANGALVRAPVAARVLWPRESYVRTLMLPSKTRLLDIPRTALAGTVVFS